MKTIKDQGEKQVDALKTLYKKLPSIKDFVPIEKFYPEIIAEIKRIEEIEKTVDRNKMVYKATNITYDFRKLKTIRAFGNEIRNNVIDIDTANEKQNELLEYVTKFRRGTKPNNPESKKLREYVLDSAKALLE